jgi:hypothetical protein
MVPRAICVGERASIDDGSEKNSMNSPHNYFRIGAATIYAGSAPSQEREAGSKLAFDYSCPAPGAVINVQPIPGSALGAISAWVQFSQAPVAARAFVYPHEHFGSLIQPIALNPNSVPASRNGGVFAWTRVPGANFSPSGNINHLLVWVQETADAGWKYSGEVTFSGVSSGGAICASGPDGWEREPEGVRCDGEDSRVASGPESGLPSGPEYMFGQFSGFFSGPELRPQQCVSGVESTFPATWRLELSGLEGPYVSLNNVYIVRRVQAAPAWENGGDAKSHCRVSMNHSAEQRCWILMVLWNGISLSAEAPAQVPFGPLHFLGHGTPCGRPRIVATPVGL